MVVFVVFVGEIEKSGDVGDVCDDVVRLFF